MTAPAGGFLNRIRERAKQANLHVVLPETADDRVIRAAEAAVAQKIARITLLGDEAEVQAKAKSLGVKLDGVAVVNPTKDSRYDAFVEYFYEKRKHKGVTLDQAKAMIADPLFFGASLVRTDAVDGMVAGSIAPTPKVIQSALFCVGVAPGLKTVSSFFLMETPRTEYGVNGAFIYSDSGCVPDPTPEQLGDIAVSAAQHCELLLEAEPRIAFLSFSTWGSASHPLVDKMKTAFELFKARNTGYKASGELQVDAAIVPAVAASKAKGSEIEGKANVMIFPNLDAGNISYKLTERLAGANAIGPILQGLDKPVNDLSRGCKYEDIVDAVAITALQAMASKARRAKA